MGQTSTDLRDGGWETLDERENSTLVSLGTIVFFFLYRLQEYSLMTYVFFRLVGQPMEVKYMRDVGMVQLTFGMPDY